MAKKDKTFTDPVSGIKYDSKEEYTLHKWLLEAGYNPELQHKFIPGRRFRADFTLVEEKIIVECMGMDIWGCAGHNNVFTIANDYKRHMLALIHGWKMVYWCKGVTKGDLLDCLNILTSKD